MEFGWSHNPSDMQCQSLFWYTFLVWKLLYLYSNSKVESRYQYFLPEEYVVCKHDDVIKWKHFPRYWPFVRGIHRWPVDSPHKAQWHEALMFSLICAWTNGWVINRNAGDLGRNRAHYDVTVMDMSFAKWRLFCSSFNMRWSTVHLLMPVLIHILPGLILGLRPANERRRYSVHWLGASPESLL